MVSRVVLCGVVCVFVHILLVISFFFFCVLHCQVIFGVVGKFVFAVVCYNIWQVVRSQSAMHKFSTFL